MNETPFKMDLRVLLIAGLIVAIALTFTIGWQLGERHIYYSNETFRDKPCPSTSTNSFIVPTFGINVSAPIEPYHG